MIEAEREKRNSTWLHAFLTRRGMSSADGRPLYAYRVSLEEYNELVRRLRDGSNRFKGSIDSFQRADSALPMLFVLFAAEWWRREYPGGHWLWAPIEDAAFGAHEWYPNLRAQCVEEGLSAWGHRASKGGKRFIGAIGSQGGIPVRLLASAQGKLAVLTQIVLRKAMRLNASSEEIEALVAAHENELPVSWRNETVLTVIAETVSTTIVLKRAYRLDASEDPIARLDRQAPGWRDLFPMPIDDAAATALMSDLVRKAAAQDLEPVTGEFVISRELEEVGDGVFQLVAAVHAPKSMDADSISRKLSIPDASKLPRQWEFFLQNTEVTRALDARRRLGDDATVLFSARSDHCRGEAAVSQQSLVARAKGIEIGRIENPPGGDELDRSMPWVFVEDGSAWVLHRAGACKIRGSLCRVVLPIMARLEPLGDASRVERVGSLQIGSRSLEVWSSDGDCEVVSVDDQHYRVRTRQPAVEPTQIFWHGTRLPFEGVPRQFWRGKPALYAYSVDGEKRRVPPSQLHWRVKGPTPAGIGSVPIVGPVEVSWVEEGEIQGRWRFTLLPEKADVRLRSSDDPCVGEIVLEHWGDVRLSCMTPAVSSSPLSGKTGLRLEAKDTPPHEIQLSVAWPGAGQATLRVPFPASGGRFFDHQGKRLPEGARLSLAQLHGAYLQVFDANPQVPTKHQLKLALGADRRQELTVSQFSLAGQDFRFRLIDLIDPCVSLLASSDDLDANVRVLISDGAKDLASVNILRYEGELEVDGPQIRLSKNSLASLTVTELEAMELHAISFRNPRSSAFALEAVRTDGMATGSWRIDDLSAAKGPWFIHPARGAHVQFRPLVLSGSGEPAPAPSGALAAAASVSDPSARRAALESALALLATDYQHREWDYIESVYAHTGHLPLSSMDIWRVFRTQPEGLVALALRQSESIGHDESLQLMGRMSRELGVVWESVPLAVWRRGAECARRQSELRVAGLPEHVMTLLRAGRESTWSMRCSRLADEHPGLRAIAGLLAAEHAGLAIDLGVWPDTARAARLANELWNGIDAGLQRYLLRPHAIQADTEVWPPHMFSASANAKTLISAARKLHPALPANLFWLDDMIKGEKLDRRASVIHTPVLLALSVTTDLLAANLRANAVSLHLHRAFDTDWFMYAFDQAMRVCIYSGLVQPFSALEASS